LVVIRLTNNEKYFDDKARLYREKGLDVSTGQKLARPEWKKQVKELTRQNLEAIHGKQPKSAEQKRLCSMCGEVKHPGKKVAQCPNRARIIKELQADMNIAKK
jgi:hypothetical protein